MSFELPRRNQTGPNEWADVEANDQKLKEEIERVDGEVSALKITEGLVKGKELNPLPASWTDCGGELTLALAVDSVVHVSTSFHFSIIATEGGESCEGTIVLDGTRQTPNAILGHNRPLPVGTEVGEDGTAGEVYRLELSAGNHALKMQAQGGGSGTLLTGVPRYSYVVYPTALLK